MRTYVAAATHGEFDGSDLARVDRVVVLGRRVHSDPVRAARILHPAPRHVHRVPAPSNRDRTGYDANRFCPIHKHETSKKKTIVTNRPRAADR